MNNEDHILGKEGNNLLLREMGEFPKTFRYWHDLSLWCITDSYLVTPHIAELPFSS